MNLARLALLYPLGVATWCVVASMVGAVAVYDAIRRVVSR